MNANPIKIMLADDHAVVRMGFRLLLEGTNDIKVVAEAESGEDAIKQYGSAHPDVVVMDISMPGIGGLEALTRILSHNPGAVCARGHHPPQARVEGRCCWVSIEA
jgi:two-component system invasion response regulator UvrY